MTDSLEKSITYCLQRAGECDREEFLREFPSPVVVVVDPEDEGADAFGTLDHGSYRGIPQLTRSQLLRDSSVVFHLHKREGANHFASMVVIGRADNCDILISSARVSKCHAIVRTKYDLPLANSGRDEPTDLVPAKFTVTDGGSTNGTAVNGRGLKSGESHELKTGDQLSLGPTISMIFFLADDFYSMLFESLEEAGTEAGTVDTNANALNNRVFKK